MLGPGIDLGHGHLDFPEIRRQFGESVSPEPFNVGNSFVYRIDSLFPCGMAALPFRNAIQHHQSFFGDCHRHSCRLPYYPEVDISPERECRFNAAFSADFLLGGRAPYKPVFLRLGDQYQIGCKGRCERGSVVIGPEPVHFSVLNHRSERVSCISSGRPDRIDMGIEKYCPASAFTCNIYVMRCGRVIRIEPDIVPDPVRGKPMP